jgi:DNA-binding protein HU-beta
MNKSELAALIQKEGNITKAQAQKVVDAIFNPTGGAIAQALKSGDTFSIAGFGTFRTRSRAARKGRNPRTGQEVTIPASIAAGFTAGKGLKDTLKKKGK